MLKGASDVSDMDIISFEMALEQNHSPVMDRPMDKIIHEQIKSHPRRHAKYRCKPETDAILPAEHKHSAATLVFP